MSVDFHIIGVNLIFISLSLGGIIVNTLKPVSYIWIGIHSFVFLLNMYLLGEEL